MCARGHPHHKKGGVRLSVAQCYMGMGVSSLLNKKGGVRLSVTQCYMGMGVSSLLNKKAVFG